jgi:predicted permease
MNLSSLLIKQIAAMFVMMAVGFVFVRVKLLKPEQGTIISKILLYAVVPCSIVNSYCIEFTASKLSGLGVSILGAAAVHAVFLLLERVLRRPLKLASVESASIIYSNAGNLIIPLVLATLGSEWVFYISGYMMVQQLLIWTHGKTMMSGTRQWDFRKIITNVNIIAIFVGIVLFLTGWRFPGFLSSAMESTAGMIAPLSMILIGMMLGGMKLRSIFGERRAYLVAGLRLVLFPLAVAAVFYITRITALHPEAKGILLITFLAAASVSATTITQFAQLYDNRPGYASTVSIITTLGCIVTIPAMVWVYQLI